MNTFHANVFILLLKSPNYNIMCWTDIEIRLGILKFAQGLTTFYLDLIVVLELKHSSLMYMFMEVR